MSFNAKNLSYEKQEPSFLRKLRGQYGDGTATRHERPNARPTKAKVTDDEDEPTYVVEDSNEVISKQEYEQLMKGESGEQDATDGGQGVDESKGIKPSVDETAAGVENGKLGLKAQQNVAEIGGSKKRKQVKVVSDDKEGESEQKSQKPQVSGKKSKQKKKKIKLSFDEE